MSDSAHSGSAAWTCFRGLSSLRWSRRDAPQERAPDPEELERILKEVLSDEIQHFQETFKKSIRSFEVCLSGGTLTAASGAGRRWSFARDVQVLQRQVLHIEHQRRRRSLEVGELRKALSDVRSALVDDATSPSATGNIAATQMLMEIREERERWRAEKRVMEQQISRMEADLKARHATPTVDPEKEKLRRTVKQLQMSIDSRDRFACWVCNQRVATSVQKEESEEEEEEEDDEQPQKERSLSREESNELVAMRRTLSAMRAELSSLRGGESQASASSSLAGEGGRIPGTRSCRGRIATPFAVGAELEPEVEDAAEQAPHELHARFREEPTAIAEVPLAADAPPMRSSRGRMPTPFVSEDIVAKEVKFVEGAAVTEVPAIGGRSVRGRIATPFMDDTLAPEPDAPQEEEVHSVSFSGAPVVVEDVKIAGDATMRRTRDRMPTPCVSLQAEEFEGDDGKAVQFSEIISKEAVPVVGQQRKSRGRIATPFYVEPMPASPARPKVCALDGNAEVEEYVVPMSTPLRQSRSRMATPFACLEAEPVESSARHVVASDQVGVHEVQVPADATLRPVRARTATPFSFGADQAEEEPGGRRRVFVLSDEAEVVCEVPVAPETPMRTPRGRILTPFVQGDALEPDEAEAAPRPGVRWSGAEEVVEGGDEASQAGLRSCRGRMPTPYVDSEVTQEEARATRNIRFAGAEEAADPDEPEGMEPSRSCRDRIATPFACDLEADEFDDASLGGAKQDSKNIHFAEGHSVVEAASAASSGPARSLRDRVPTGFADMDVADKTQEPSSVRFSDGADELEAWSPTAAGIGATRSVRGRQATGFVTEDVGAEAPPARGIRFAGDLAPAPSWQPPHSVRFSGQDQEVEALSPSTAGIGATRSIRGRQATGFIVEDGVDAEAALAPQAPATAAAFRLPGVRPAGSAAAPSRPQGVTFTGEDQEVEAWSPTTASRAGITATRSARGRQATGFLADDALEEAPASSSHAAPSNGVLAPSLPAHVRFSGTEEEVEGWSPSAVGIGATRSVRGRQATGFVTEDAAGEQRAEAPATSASPPRGGIRFSGDDQVLEAASVTSSAPRSLRDRQSTGYITSDGAGLQEVRFSGGAEDMDDALASGLAPRVRPPAGEASASEPERAARSHKGRAGSKEGGNVSFGTEVDIGTAASFAAPHGDAKAIRERVPTGFAFGSVTDDRCVRFSQGVRFMEGGDDDRSTFDERTHSGRCTETSSNKSAGDSDASGGGVPRHPRFDDVVRDHSDEGAISDAETVSSCSSRNLRSRMNTPYMSASSLGFEVADAASAAGEAAPPRRRRSKGNATTPVSESSAADRRNISHASMVSSIEREISERVKRNSQRQARGDRMVRVMSGGVFQPTLPSGPGAGDASPESGMDDNEALERRRLPGAQKDRQLLKRTLQGLCFFEEFDNEALEELADAMEVYSFEDGDIAVRQGDKEGSHFFVVAEGGFAVTRDGRRLATLGPGDAFGETVLLLFGERTASVTCVGNSTAYGMDGIEVRDLLRQQFERKREATICAMEEVLTHGKCDIFAGLSAYQLQSLFDKAEVRHYAAGEVLLEEGSGEPKELLLLCGGSFEVRRRGSEPRALDRYTVVGDEAMVFGEQPATIAAQGYAEALVLSKDLLTALFGEQLQDVLVRGRILESLAAHEVFSQLHIEQLEAVAAACEIKALAPGDTLQADDMRFVLCLHGDVDATYLDGSGQLEETHSLSAAPAVAEYPTFGDANLRSRDNPRRISLRAEASAQCSAMLVVWRCADLDSILHDEDLKFALDHNYKIRVLKSVQLFRNLPMQQLQSLAKRMQIQHVDSGHTIVEQGTMGTHFYIIHKGLVEVVIQGEVVRTLGTGDYFGERALLFNEPRTANIVAIEDRTELWVMGKQTFGEIVQGTCFDYLKDRIQLQDTRVEMRELEFVRVVGRGGFGVVKMVRNAKTGMRYALKCVRKRPIVEKDQQETIINERSILLEVDHPFLVKFVRSFTSPKKVYFLMELVSGGELLDVLYILGLLSRSQAQFYTGSIVLALEFLHAHHIAYLDLKSENCLIDCHGYVKLIDFGIAKRIKGKGFARRGTPMFMAPEMIRNTGYTTIADLWSLGICLYEFVLGEFPFVNNVVSSQAHIFKEVLESELTFPEHFSRDPACADTIAFLRGLLTKDPARRLGASAEGYAAIKEHKFFEGLHWDMLMGRELKPPYIPGGESYAEDKEEVGNASAQPMSLEELEAADHEDDDWCDPHPGWDAGF